MSPMPLLADDLTGALDSGCAFARPDAPLAVHLDLPRRRTHGAFVVPTREATPEIARHLSLQALDRLPAAGPVFKKIDSLLRGPWAVEVAAAMTSGRFRRCILAPAFPAQGRITAGGRQWLRDGGGSTTAVPRPLLEAFPMGGPAAAGWTVGALPPSAPILVADAATDADLARIVAAGRDLEGPVLWCGTGGLARALAGPPVRTTTVSAPLLGLVGTAHPTTVAQFDRLDAAARVVVRPDDDAAVARIAAAQAAAGGAVVAFAIDDPSRAAACIDAGLERLLSLLPAPATLFVTGGETLLGIARLLGAERLEVSAECEPGVPWSRFGGGRWDGVRVLSKSGAFGAPDLLQRLVAAARA